MGPQPPRILVCQCQHANLLPEERLKRFVQELSDSQQPYELIPDLCDMAARERPALIALVGDSKVKIAACHARAVHWLLRAAGISGPVETVNLRRETREQTGLQAQPVAERAVPAQANAQTWTAWYPVVDFERCTHCMQCLGFCLFGVFGVDAARKLAVVAPEACKPNCPACSRVCPEAAIIFPKYRHAPINGEEVTAQTEKVKVDISALMGGDLYSALRERSTAQRQRFSPEADSAKALAERRQWVAQLVEAGEIPPEALANLPGPGELRRLAEAAAMRATQAFESGAAAPSAQAVAGPAEPND